jgi:hypothetical protein
MARPRSATLGSHGWAVVKVADDHGEAEAVRLVRADDAQAPDSSGAVLWCGRHTVLALARSVIRAFDRIDHEQGEEAYEAQWGRPFPRTELDVRTYRD